MTKEKRILYSKAYVELYEMIKLLSDEERRKIPDSFVEYIYNNMDKEYTFNIDKTKELLEQEYMVETKALIVKLYERYFATESETEFWNKYHKICFNMIDEEKKKKYNSNDIFKKKEEAPIDENIKTKENIQMIEYKEPIFKRIINKILNFLHLR